MFLNTFFSSFILNKELTKEDILKLYSSDTLAESKTTTTTTSTDN